MGRKMKSVRRMSDEELMRKFRCTQGGGRDSQARNRIYQAEMSRRGLPIVFYSQAGGGSTVRCLKGRNF